MELPEDLTRLIVSFLPLNLARQLAKWARDAADGRITSMRKLESTPAFDRGLMDEWMRGIPARHVEDSKKFNSMVARFVNLEQIHARGSFLPSELDLRSCRALVFLDCSRTPVEKVYLTECARLSTLDCSLTHLERLDLTRCPLLTGLACAHSSNILSLDLTKCPLLDHLDIIGCYRMNVLRLATAPKNMYMKDCSEDIADEFDIWSCGRLAFLDLS